MATYKIDYSGWTTATVEANTPEQAVELFWDKGLNELNDAEIESITEEASK